jgi:hypothetical protein
MGLQYHRSGPVAKKRIGRTVLVIKNRDNVSAPTTTTTLAAFDLIDALAIDRA